MDYIHAKGKKGANLWTKNFDEIIKSHAKGDDDSSDGEMFAYDSPRSFSSFLKHFVESSQFNNFILFCIVINSIFLALQVDPSMNIDQGLFEVIDAAFYAIYLMEFVLKNFVNFKGYWKGGYNIFDALVLGFSTLSLLNVFGSQGNFSFLRLLRATRALRAFRGVSFIRQLQVIVNALVKTTSSIINLLGLLMLMMFVFAIIAINFFGDVKELKDDWGTLGNAMMTLFIYVTADNWTDIQDRLDEHIGLESRVFSVIFIFLGNLIFTNLFIGVVIQNLDEATEEDKKIQKLKRDKMVSRKKAFVLARQQREIAKLFEHYKKNKNVDIHSVMESLVGNIRHDDLVPMTFIGCNVNWMRLYLNGLEHQENTMYRNQQLHFEIAFTLSEMLDRTNQLQLNQAKYRPQLDGLDY